MGLLYTTDLGENWNKINSLNPNSIYSIVINTSEDIFCSAQEGLFRSTDEGISWAHLDSTLDAELAITSGDDLIAATYDSVYKSTNNGNSWDNITGNLPNGAILDVIVSKLNNYIYVIKNYSEIYRSTDMGNNWTSVSNGLYPSFTCIYSSKEGNLFAGGVENLYLSTNFGDQWNSIKTSELSNSWVVSIITNLPGEILVGTMGGGIYFSSNYGSNWEIRNNALNSGVVVKVLVEDNYMFCATHGAGIFRSSNGGVNWEKVNGNIPTLFMHTLYRHNDGSLFAGTSAEGTYKSTNNGESWSLSSSIPITTFTSNSLGYIFAGAQGFGLYRSTDAGISWEDITSGISYLSIQQLEVSNNDEIFACYPDSLFYKSTNNGNSWVLTNNGLSGDLTSIGIDSSNNIYVGSSRGFFFSTNDGEDWTKISELNRISEITITPDNIIYGVKYSGVYYSTNNGADWTFIGNGSDNSFAKTLGTNFNQFLYLGTWGSGLYRFDVSVLSSDEEMSVINNNFNLFQNYPNPFNPKTTISYLVPEESFVKLNVFNSIGELVKQLVNEIQQAGKYKIIFNGENLASGVYYYQLISDYGVITKKILLLK